MDYIGIDHMIGLSCAECRSTTALPYSRLLNALLDGRRVVCGCCRRTMNHGWDSIKTAQLLVDRHMREGRKRVVQSPESEARDSRR